MTVRADIRAGGTLEQAPEVARPPNERRLRLVAEVAREVWGTT